MSIIVSSTVSPKPGVAPDQPMLTPEQLIEQVHALRRQIPDFVTDPNSRELQRLRNQTRLDIRLTRDAMSVVGAADVVQSAVGNTSAELRDAESEWSRWLSAESELRALLRGVTAANVVRRYRLASAVRQVYKISRALAEKDEFAQLVPHVEAMYRVKNRKKGKTPDTEVKQ